MKNILINNDHKALANIGTNTHAQIDTFIGTTVPATYVAKAGDTMTGALTITPSADSTSVLKVTNAANTRSDLVINTTNGTVGIGKTPDATVLLDIYSDQSRNIVVDTVNPYFTWKDGGTVIGKFGKGSTIMTNGSTTGIGFRSEDLLTFSAGGQATQMILDNTGQLGIGATPTTKLQVEGIILGNDTYGFAIGGIANVRRIQWESGDSFFRFYGNSGSYVNVGAKGLSIGATYGSSAPPTSGAIFEGNVGIGVTDPTAVLHLKAGTATANSAPLKFNSGTLNTTAEAGAMEFLTDDFYATITTSAARKMIVLNDGTALTDGRIPEAHTNGRLIDSTFLTSSNFLRSTTANYRRYYHLATDSFDPGASGATWTSPSANTTGGWRLDANTEVLTFDTDVHADWDGASDLAVEVFFALNVAGVNNDTVDLKLQAFYNTTGDSACKTQTVEVATVTDGTQYKVYKATFTINYDEVSNVVEAGDKMGFILNLETDTSEIDDIIVTHAEFYYNTAHVGIESGDV